jgi:hypothetical protein
MDPAEVILMLQQAGYGVLRARPTTLQMLNSTVRTVRSYLQALR